jgi:hypothetical protein
MTQALPDSNLSSKSLNEFIRHRITSERLKQAYTFHGSELRPYGRGSNYFDREFFVLHNSEQVGAFIPDAFVDISKASTTSNMFARLGDIVGKIIRGD